MDWFSGEGTFYNYTCQIIYLVYGCADQVLWGPQTQNHTCNVEPVSCPLVRDQWQWIEWRAKVNTPGVANGEFDLWINDVHKAHYTNMRLFDSTMTGTGWDSIIHTAEYGGGGSTLAAIQYWWVDHTVISTTRIGMPGGSLPTDTTPPGVPTGLTVQ
jgi:hypothetical protein